MLVLMGVTTESAVGTNICIMLHTKMLYILTSPQHYSCENLGFWPGAGLFPAPSLKYLILCC